MKKLFACLAIPQDICIVAVSNTSRKVAVRWGVVTRQEETVTRRVFSFRTVVS